MTPSKTRPLGALLVLAALLCTVSPAAAQQAAAKIAVVDVELVVAGSVAGQELQARLAEFRQRSRGELQGQMDELAALRSKLLDPETALTARQGLQKEFEEKSIALKRAEADLQREGQKLQDQGLRDIESALAPILTAIQREQGYDLILGRTPGVVLLVADRVNITSDVIERFNQQ